MSSVSATCPACATHINRERKHDEFRGSHHCGNIAFDVECNCSHCSRKGYLLWYLPREKLRLTTDEKNLSRYLFNKQVIKHHFCPNCGCAPFGFGTGRSGRIIAAVNVRCLEGIERSSLKITQFDGRRL